MLLVLHEMFPSAPLYTSVYNPKTALWAKVFPKIYTSFLQNIPFAKDNHEVLAPLMPFAFEQFDFDDYDLVISVTSEAAKGIITKPATKHICICLTPTRYLWSGYKEYFKNPFFRFFLKPIVNYMRKWDEVAALRPDIMVGISNAVCKRIKKYYKRDSKLIFPPVALQKRKLQKKSLQQEYFLVVSRLVPYKKVDLAIGAFNRLERKLVVVGKGSEEKRLKSISGPNIIFPNLKVTNDESLAWYYKNCKALVFPQEEDFGLVAVEAMKFGKPVIAFKAGGALDIVKDGVNGLFFKDQTVASLISAVKRFDTVRFRSGKIIDTTRKFSKVNFKKSMLNLINNK